MNKTKIDWCDMTWNPVTGCLHGCEYCYAQRIAERFGLSFAPKLGDPGMDGAAKYDSVEGLDTMLELENAYQQDEKIQPYPMAFSPTFHRYRLNEPQRIKKSQRVFVVSMGDLFGDWVPDEWIKEVFKACAAAPWHKYLFLTKNPGRYGKINGWDHRYDYGFATENMWLGMTITGKGDIKKLRKLPYGRANTFVSIEPLSAEIDLGPFFPKSTTRWKCSFCGHYSSAYSLHCGGCGEEGGYSGSFRKQPINWVIIGAETGNRKDKIVPRREWIERIVDDCRAAGVPVFMKNNMAAAWGDDLIQEWPESLKGE